ncbi:MAG TPA: NAD(P)/FAD-dependent oxidoreductase [Sphingomonadales bacterium]|nr:NAD(P)/FAD-dependent oxidoreductase [Sphingomonadales bacterium]
MTDFDAVIIGAGAAGLMCAIEGGKRGRRILVIEKNEAVAGKIRISGGGRCNFTNLHTGPENFLSDNPRFCLSALRRYLPQNFIRLVEKHDIAYHEKKLGQLFCDGKSHQIIDMLLKECDQAGVIIRTETTVEDIQKTDTGFRLLTADETFTCRSLVIASGGKSIPKMGASGFGYEVASHFGHSLIDPAPALVPLTFQNDLLGQFKSLAGVSVEATVRRGKISFTEALLFTHRGLSGPAILQISSYMEPGDEITIDLSPHRDMLAFLKEQRTAQPKQELHTILTQRFARRLAQFICQEAGVDGRLADLSNQKFEQVARFIHGWTIKPGGTEGFRTAEVTRGGVNTREISSKTFESNLTPGLYFIGEVLDVTGHLGGYNFQWAWASGHGAGQYI